MKYILIVIFATGGGITAEFNDQKSCLDAAIAAVTKKGDIFTCADKGEPGIVKTARTVRDDVFEMIKGATDGN